MNNLGVKLVFQFEFFVCFVFSPLCATILHKYKILFGGFIRKGRASFREKQKLPINFSPAPKKNFKDNNKNIHIPRKNLILMIIKYFFSSVFLLRHRNIQIKKLPRLARVKLGDDIIIPIIKQTHLSQTISCWLSEIYTISVLGGLGSTLPRFNVFFFLQSKNNAHALWGLKASGSSSRPNNTNKVEKCCVIFKGSS